MASTWDARRPAFDSRSIFWLQLQPLSSSIPPDPWPPRCQLGAASYPRPALPCRYQDEVRRKSGAGVASGHNLASKSPSIIADQILVDGIDIVIDRYH